MGMPGCARDKGKKPMRIVLAGALTVSLALLAACGGAASNNSAGNAAAGNGASAAPAAPTDPQLVAMRASALQTCGSQLGRMAPPGSDIPRLCGCAVDRLMAGKTAEQLRRGNPGDEERVIRACAGELGIALPSQPPAPAAPPLEAPTLPGAGNSAN
jgi:hypothetical protein